MLRCGALAPAFEGIPGGLGNGFHDVHWEKSSNRQEGLDSLGREKAERDGGREGGREGEEKEKDKKESRCFRQLRSVLAIIAANSHLDGLAPVLCV